ncbi:MAG: M20/M25/M40 family metallo-hydrolase [Inquilinaceae bacterium]
MSRQIATDLARQQMTSGALLDRLTRRVAMPTESQVPGRRAVLLRYLEDEIAPELAALGCDCAVHDTPDLPSPFLIATRHEGADLPTILTYGHGDVVHGAADAWSDGLSPWTLTERDGRLYGRGIVDNKGQHSINFAALAAVLEARGGALGFNLKVLIETGEEIGSVGLQEFCAAHADALAADVLIASDGPRLRPETPTVFLGSRGSLNFDLRVAPRSSPLHSGNFGGIASNPALRLAHALASIASPRGEVLVSDWLPKGIDADVREALRKLPDDPSYDRDWGAPALSPAERLYAWSSFEVLALDAGNPAQPINAIPPAARARAQLRFPPGMTLDRLLPDLRRHLERAGFSDVEVARARKETFEASRTSLSDPWVARVMASLARTHGGPPDLLPNLGGTIPNAVFTDTLGMPTIWIPHSYRGCQQHGPDEHVPRALMEDAVRIMAGLFWDLGAERHGQAGD